MNNFQEFILAWQYSEDVCNNGGVQNGKYSEGGLGYVYSLGAIEDFLTALETGKVYRPTYAFSWADAGKISHICALW